MIQSFSDHSNHSKLTDCGVLQEIMLRISIRRLESQWSGQFFHRWATSFSMDWFKGRFQRKAPDFKGKPMVIHHQIMIQRISIIPNHLIIHHLMVNYPSYN